MNIPEKQYLIHAKRNDKYADCLAYIGIALVFGTMFLVALVELTSY